MPIVIASHTFANGDTTPVNDSLLNECLAEAVVNATSNTTVAELRDQCAKRLTKETALDQAITAERQSMRRHYSLTPHNPNFILPFTYNSEPYAIDENFGDGEQALDKTEVSFQVSLKFPLILDLFQDTDLVVAYTAESWWQLYNSELSAPFRETNYQPEFFFRHYGGPSFLGGKLAGVDFGFSHESNGRTQLLSRSWNRIFAATAFEYDDLTLLLKTWYRIPEEEEHDDNPELYRYLGYGQARAIYTPNKNTFSALFRPGTRKNGLELTWSYPISNHLRVYSKIYSGYGESLIDYDSRVQRISIGFAINDYLQVRW